MLVAQSLRSRGLRSALNSWMDAATERAQALETMMSVAKTLRYRGLRASWNSWVAVAELLIGVKGLLSSMVHNSSRRAFNAWATNAYDQIERHRLLKSACVC